MRHSYRPAIPPKPQPYRTQVLDHLGLVAGMFEELGVTVQAVKTGITPQLAISDHVRAAEQGRLHHGEPLHTPR